MITHVTYCGECPLARTIANMVFCGHPDSVWHPYIITNKHMKQGVPRECPLRKQAHTQKVVLLVPNKAHVDDVGNRKEGNVK